MKLNLKLFAKISVGIIFATTTIGVVTYKIFQNSKQDANKKQTQKIKAKNNPENTNENDPFPTLEAEFFNSELKQDQNGNYYIDESLILSILKDISSRFGKSTGKIEFHYEKITGTTKQDDYLILYLKYEKNGYTWKKKYKIFLTN